MVAEKAQKRDVMFDLAEHIVNTKYEALSPQDREMVKKCVLDTLGTLVAGSAEPPFKQLMAYLKDQGGKEESTIMVYGGKVPTRNAVMANAAMARALDLDDTHAVGIHPSVCMVPAAFGVAERQGGKSGKEFMIAVALGQDLLLRMAAACNTIPTARGRCASHIFGTFGTAAVAGKLLGLSKDKMVDALGNANCQMTGDQACLFDGALSQRVHQGIAASAGVFAAILADIGVIGSHIALEGWGGYYHAHEKGEYKREVLTDGLGKKFWGTSINVKPFPTQGGTHTPMSATLEMVLAEDIKPDDIEEIVVHTTQFNYDVVGSRPEKIDPKGAVHPKFSMPWAIGTIVAKRKAWIDDFSEEGVKKNREAVLPIARKVKVVMDPEIEKVAKGELRWRTRVEIRTKDGKLREKKLDYHKGHPKNPLTWEEMATRFRSCVPFAARPLPAGKVEEIIRLVKDLEEVDDVTRIVKLLG